MFTRLDSDRNAKIMKKAVIEEKLDPGSYKVSGCFFLCISHISLQKYINKVTQEMLQS